MTAFPHAPDNSVSCWGGERCLTGKNIVSCVGICDHLLLVTSSSSIAGMLWEAGKQAGLACRKSLFVLSKP